VRAAGSLHSASATPPVGPLTCAAARAQAVVRRRLSCTQGCLGCLCERRACKQAPPTRPPVWPATWIRVWPALLLLRGDGCGSGGGSHQRAERSGRRLHRSRTSVQLAQSAKRGSLRAAFGRPTGWPGRRSMWEGGEQRLHYVAGSLCCYYLASACELRPSESRKAGLDVGQVAHLGHFSRLLDMRASARVRSFRCARLAGLVGSAEPVRCRIDGARRRSVGADSLLLSLCGGGQKSCSPKWARGKGKITQTKTDARRPEGAKAGKVCSAKIETSAGAFIITKPSSLAEGRPS